MANIDRVMSYFYFCGYCVSTNKSFLRLFCSYWWSNFLQVFSILSFCFFIIVYGLYMNLNKKGSWAQSGWFCDCYFDFRYPNFYLYNAMASHFCVFVCISVIKNLHCQNPVTYLFFDIITNDIKNQNLILFF